MKKDYDSSWDLGGNDKAFDRKYKEWKQRPWESWLRKNLKFPFQVERVENHDDAYSNDIAKFKPFRVGHIMEAMGIETEDDLYGIIVKVKEGRNVGHVPLCNVKVTSEEDGNYWPVREYVVWFANR